MAKKPEKKKLPGNDGSRTVQAAFEATHEQHLQEVLQKRQPRKTGTTFREQMSVDRLRSMVWNKAQREFPGLPSNIEVYVTSEVGGFQDLVPLEEIHPHMLLEVQSGLKELEPVVRGNFRIPVAETYILLEVEADRDPVVVDVIPGGPVRTQAPDRTPGGVPLVGSGDRAVCSLYRAAGFTHARVLPRAA